MSENLQENVLIGEILIIFISLFIIVLYNTYTYKLIGSIEVYTT